MATFAATVLGVPNQGEEQGSIASLTYSSASTLLQTEETDLDRSDDSLTTFLDSDSEHDDDRLKKDIEVTFYHCRPGSFWNATLSDNKVSSCRLCITIEGNNEVTFKECFLVRVSSESSKCIISIKT